MPSQYRRDAARLKAEIVERIAAGEIQRTICGTAGMPCAHTVRNWALGDAAFGAELVAAREEALDFELWVAAERVPPGPVREMNRAVAPITRTIARLRHRPGAVHRRRNGEGRSPLGPANRS